MDRKNDFSGIAGSFAGLLALVFCIAYFVKGRNPLFFDISIVLFGVVGLEGQLGFYADDRKRWRGVLAAFIAALGAAYASIIIVGY